MTKKSEVIINKHGASEFVEFIVRGDQTPTSVNVLADQAEKLIDELRTAGKPTLVLDNLSEMGEVPYAARKVVVQRAKAIEYDKLAFYSHNVAIRFGSNLVVRAIGKGDKVKHFDNYDAAVTWLTDIK